MDTIIVNNITQTDVKNNRLRIVKRNQFLFPTELIGQRITSHLKFVHQDIEYFAKYHIGSTDGISRSGVIQFSKEAFSALKIKPGAEVTIKRNQELSFYEVLI